MPKPRLIVCVLLAGCVPGSLLAQNSDHEWAKSYTVSGKPTLTLESGDADMQVTSCGDCRAVGIRIDSKRKLSDYRIEESQSGDNISFSLKQKPEVIHLTWKKPAEAPRVIIQAPAEVALEAHSSDGNLMLSNLKGDFQLRTSDGNLDASNIDGSLRLTSSDGNITITNGGGTLEARASDGHITVDGRFTSVQMHTSDGNLDLSLADGSQLSSASRVESSDGRVRIRLPKTLAADLDISTSDGRIDCSLPLVLDHYNSNGDGHKLQGRLNAGGVPLTVHTSDGNVTIASL